MRPLTFLPQIVFSALAKLLPAGLIGVAALITPMLIILGALTFSHGCHRSIQ